VSSVACYFSVDQAGVGMRGKVCWCRSGLSECRVQPAILVLAKQVGNERKGCMPWVTIK
jgi:hypothetical protein